MVKLNIKPCFETIKNRFDLQIPAALPWGEWDKWHAKTKNERPFAYFIMETIPSKFDNFIKFFTRPINDLRYAIRVRVFDRYHVIKTGLKPGYTDCDTRMMHGMFNMLIDFVEVEKAWMQVVFSTDEQKKYKHPWWSLGLTRFKSFRDPQAGIDYLKWEMTLDSPSLSNTNQSPTQASAAREIWEIYHWWKFARPMRPDPNDASGWTEHCELCEQRGRALFDFENETAEERARSRECLDRSIEIEAAYEAEDESYLIRLIKIRKSLWT